MDDYPTSEFVAGLMAVRTAALTVARAEADRIVSQVAADLRKLPPSGIFGDDVAPRHTWDEYCWNVQEGPFDVPLMITPGTLADAFGDLLHSAISNRIETLDSTMLVLLSEFAAEECGDIDAEAGAASLEAVIEHLMGEIRKLASKPPLELIGPHRADALEHLATWTGVVCSELSEQGLVGGIAAHHLGDLIDPTSDLSEVAGEMADAFIDSVLFEDQSALVAKMLGQLGRPIKDLLVEEDILPSLRSLRMRLVARLDS